MRTSGPYECRQIKQVLEENKRGYENIGCSHGIVVVDT